MSNKLMGILRYALLIPLFVVIMNSIRFLRMGYYNLVVDGYGIQMLVCFFVATIIGVCIIFCKKLTIQKKLAFILGIAFIIRLIWIISVPSVPVSDYETMYTTAKEIAQGDFSGMWGVSYFARYPHLTTTVVYMTFIHLIFGAYDLIAMKVVSLILSVFNVYMIYKISLYFVKREKVQLFTAFMASVFPPFIAYVSTFCTENIAIPFLLVSVLYFCKILNGKTSKKNVILCGVMLGISHLFRGVGAIFVVAMLIALCLHKVKCRIRIISAIIAIMVAVMVLVSVPLRLIGITEHHLWNGTESGITYVLKGLNIESKGAWNEEDATFVEEHYTDDDFNTQCIQIIESRLGERTPNELAKFFFDKFINQWSYGDCNGSFWAFMRTNLKYKYPIDFASQLVYCTILVLSLISLLKRQEKHPTLLHLLVCGFGLFLLVFETQPRYSYIVLWVFIFMSVQGIETLCELMGRLKCLKK